MAIRSVAAQGTAPEPAPARRGYVNRDARFGYALLLPTAAADSVCSSAIPSFVRCGSVFTRNCSARRTRRGSAWRTTRPSRTITLSGQSVKNTFVFTGGSIVRKLIIGTTVALILNEALPLRALWRSIVLLPYAMPTLVSVLVWKWMYNDVGGVFNYLLHQTHIRERPTLWLADPSKAMRSVIAVNVWRGFPFFVITILAGLQAVPQELYDAAKVDGAGIWARFWKVTLPGILPVMAVVTLVLDDPHLQRFLDHLGADAGRPGQRDGCARDADLQDRHSRPRTRQGRRGLRADAADPRRAHPLAQPVHQPPGGTRMTVKSLAGRTAARPVADKRILVPPDAAPRCARFRVGAAGDRSDDGAVSAVFHVRSPRSTRRRSRPRARRRFLPPTSP